jgi:hypothetical protein
MKTLKKEHPILFSTPMVQAILNGTKTQTRRIIKPQPDSRGLRTSNVMWEDWHGREVKCPYGEHGDIIWVRETWNKIQDVFFGGEMYIYKEKYVTYKRPGASVWKWKPSIYMPKEACRIRLLIKDIRVERLCDITEEDAIVEGIEMKTGIFDHINGGIHQQPSDIYAELWDKIHGDGSWIKNPFVWVIEFKKL